MRIRKGHGALHYIPSYIGVLYSYSILSTIHKEILMQILKNKKPWRALLLSSALVLSVASAPAAAADLVVSAAASLTNAFTEIGKNFEKQHEGVNVLNSFAASDVLMQQIVNGAPVDVYASADQKAMDKAVEANTIKEGTRKDFAQNKVVLIVPIDNPLKIENLAGLNQKEVTRIAYGNPASVPVGRYTQGALEQTGDWETVEKHKILGQNVRQVLDYVARGEVDAGFVFATDAAIMKDKVLVVETLETTVPVTYPVAIVKEAKQPELAQAYETYLLSDEGQAVLAKYGFSKP